MRNTERKCENCSHFRIHTQFLNRQAVCCELTNVLMKSESAQTCDFYNRDVSSLNICFNCKHFAGGGDWGLACRKHYHMLPNALTDMCDDAERS